MRYLFVIMPLLFILSACVSTKRSTLEDSSRSSHLEFNLEDIQKYAEQCLQRTDVSVNDSTSRTAHISIRIYDTEHDIKGRQKIKAEAEIDINDTNVRKEHREDSLLETKQEEHELESYVTDNDTISNHVEKENVTEATAAESFFKRFGSAILLALVILSVSYAIRIYKRKD